MDKAAAISIKRLGYGEQGYQGLADNAYCSLCRVFLPCFSLLADKLLVFASDYSDNSYKVANHVTNQNLQNGFNQHNRSILKENALNFKL